MPCIELDGEFYIPKWIQTNGPDYTDSCSDFERDFGEYYDDLMELMDTEKYTKIPSEGTIVHYGVIEVQELVNKFFK